MTWTVNTDEKYNSLVRRPRIQPYITARTERLGTDSIHYSSKEIGKAVKLDGSQCVLCADGDPIYGFVESVEAATQGGYSIGGVLADPGLEVLATDELGALAVEDEVVCGTPVAVGTANASTGANVRKGPARSVLLISGAAGMKSGEKQTAETTAALRALVRGKVVTKAAGDLPALSGTVDNGTFNVFAFFIDSAGVFTSQMGTAGATLADVVQPEPTSGKALVALLYINPTGTGDFVGGTTELDDGTVVPNAAFVNPVGYESPRSPHTWQVLEYYGTQGAGKQVLLRKV